ncbi:heterokaryon incompatibility protein-domain-containing protein [Dichotomopilus funicola]|uniref:Heterokaryon incompatibility protein-domain-containing protein n=1 Tax=Dichotomopilus funicola TaxID=1934379 RepID=A0AAN6ZJN3_9PEZI|nr:heterokaryon incompatibility protein-domain-containing protein [Dichotomopilus funicola]
MLPEVAGLDDAKVRIDVLETQGRARLCTAVRVGATGKEFKEEKLEVYSHEPTPFPLVPVCPPPRYTTKKDHVVAQIKTWMAACSTNHRICSANTTLMPRRVLKISQGGQRVNLHLTKGRSAPYLTLSHCWGPRCPLQTSKTNIGRHLHNIPLNDLPPLFRDAIALTASLGHQYLWIDSLCIIQDSPIDWDRESSMMASIYAGSTLTLAATHASSSASSLFSPRSSTPITISPTTKTIPYTLYARPATRHLPRHPNATSFPLLTRAWVYQERLLSPRVVHFGPDELAWECSGGGGDRGPQDKVPSLRCECGYFDRSAAASGGQGPLGLHDRFGADVKAQHAACLLRAAAHGSQGGLPAPKSPSSSSSSTLHWHSLALAIGYPPFSGLAKQMRGVRPKARYLAGLWEDSFFRDLLWVSVLPNPGLKKQMGKDEKRNGAEPEWLAPTWSWASRGHAVRYTNGQRIQVGGLGIYQPAEMGNSGDVASELVGGSCELLAAECVPAGVDDTGKVKSGWVKVKGYVVEVGPVCELVSAEQRERWVVTVNGVKSWDVFWDEPPQGHEEGGGFWSEKFSLLRIGCIPATGEKEPYDEWSLLLRRVGDGVFERCGIVGRSKRFSSFGAADMAKYYEHTRGTSPWFGDVKEPVVIVIV